MYLQEDIKKGIRLYNYLQEHGELKFEDNREYFNYFSEENVRDIITSFEEECNVNIRKYENVIYFMPAFDNEFLGYKRLEIKKEIFGRTDMLNIDLYTALYIMIFLTGKLYNSKGVDVKSRDFISIGELDEAITERLEVFSDGEYKEIDEKTKLAISDIAKKWLSLINEDDASSIKTRRWYILQVISFMKKENLVIIQDETLITPTNKFTNLARNHFLNFDRLDEIKEILKYGVSE